MQKQSLEHQLVNADNLLFLNRNRRTLAHTIDFIYINPTETRLNIPGNNPKKTMKNQYATWIKETQARIEAAIPLLKNTGVFVASADDSYLPHLRIMLDEVFGVQNFVGMMVVDSGNIHNNARFLSVTHEYVLVYVKNLQALTKSDVRWRQRREGLEVLRRKEDQLRKQFNVDYARISLELKTWLGTQNVPKRLKAFYNADEKGLYTYSDLSAPANGLRYNVIHPLTQEIVPVPSRGWGISEDTFAQLIEHNMIIWGQDAQSQPLKKLYLKDAPDQVIRGVSHIPSRTPVQLVNKILGPHQIFGNPKSLDLIKYLIEVMCPEDGTVLDFYAGSGTTGHAVLDLNYENISSLRKFILVNNNEKNIFTQVLLPRIKAVISGVWADGRHHPRPGQLKVEAVR